MRSIITDREKMVSALRTIADSIEKDENCRVLEMAYEGNRIIEEGPPENGYRTWVPGPYAYISFKGSYTIFYPEKGFGAFPGGDHEEPGNIYVNEATERR